MSKALICSACKKDLTGVLRHNCPEASKSPLTAPETQERHKKRIYLVGPMEGMPDSNYPAFDEAAARGRALGYEIINPAEIDCDLGITADNYRPRIKEVIRHDVEEVLASDAIALLPGWNVGDRKGSPAEHRIAIWAGKEILDARTFEPYEDDIANILSRTIGSETVVFEAPDATQPVQAFPAFKPGLHEAAGGFVLTDTGNRKVFATGAQRDAAGMKGWFHGIPFVAIERWAQWLEAGGKKYGKHNWRKGIPLSNYLDSAGRHYFKLCEAMVQGVHPGEDHAAATLWNIGGFIWTQNEIKEGRLPAYLDNVADDLPLRRAQGEDV